MRPVAYFVCGLQLVFLTTHLPSYLAMCGMDPMLSAKALGTIGGFNVMGSTGYSFSTNNQRSDYWYLSGHVDMDLMNWHHVYPLFEMNYFLNTTDAKSTPIGVAGRDLINFGGQAGGKGMITGAFGARFKISENSQIGGAFEIPFAGPKDLFQYRFMLDFILRY